MANGTIHPLFEEVLEDIGKWMSFNGEVVYDTIPWKQQGSYPLIFTASVVSVLVGSHINHVFISTIGLVYCIWC